MYRRRILIFIMLIGLVLGSFFIYTFYRVFFKPNTAFSNSEAYIFISNNSTFNDVVKDLEAILISTEDFILAAEKKGYSNRIKGGKYIIKKGLNNHQIINILRNRSIPIKVTFNNQERLENLAGRIAKQIATDSLSLIKAFRDDDFLNANGFSQDSAISMYLPNSYEVFWNISADEFRARMLKEYNRFWNTSRLEKAKALNLSPQQIIVLASIVQKETSIPNERNRIAGVYLNRLRRRMRLEADPTVIFAIKHKYQKFDTLIRRVLTKDLKVESPYNTYKYSGLPPGPITMPDILTIEAVLKPEEHQYYYFVANPSQPGYHVFAKNYRQHLKNSKAYHRWINSKKLYR